jgi:endonuclease/exonuclease/phosphatase family metal-dependent hydrolase
VRLLLDEMIPAIVAAELRRRGHDVVAVQEPELRHLRGGDDLAVLQHAQGERRALVSDNVPDLLRCHRRLLGAGQRHHGLVLFGNATFPRHRHETFVGRIVAALDAELQAQRGDDHSSWIRWLGP